MREKLRAFGEVERLDDALREASRLYDENARLLAEAQGRLSPALADLDLFARSPSPEAGAIEQAARAFDDFSARKTVFSRQGSRSGGKTCLEPRPIAQAGAARARSQVWPTCAPLAPGATQAWRDLRGLFGGAAPPDPARLQDRALVFETLSTEADRSADALLASAAQVAAAEAEREKIALHQAEKDRAEAALAELQP